MSHEVRDNLKKFIQLCASASKVALLARRGQETNSCEGDEFCNARVHRPNYWAARRAMRVFTWLLTLALGVECFAGSFLADVVMQSLVDEQRAPPGFTSFFFGHPTWWLVIPIPWVIASFVLSRRPSPAIDLILLFAGTVAVAAAFLLGIMVIAAILPFLTIKG